MSDGESFNLSGGDTAETLRSLFGRGRLIDERKLEVAEEFNELVAEAKAMGFDGATFRRLIMRARKDPAALEEADQLLSTYEAITSSGASAAGTLSMEKGEDGMFRPRMIQGGAEAEQKLSRSAQARRSAVDRAELARRAREGA